MSLNKSLYMQIQQLAEVGHKLGLLEARIDILDLDRTASGLADQFKNLNDDALRLDNSIRSSIITRDDTLELLDCTKSKIFE
mgnify:CR=1|jgi:hypothetical protein